MSMLQELRPDVDMMREHLMALFGNQVSGRIEIAWTDPASHALKHAETFDVLQIEAAAARAAELNATPMCNVYVGAALRSANTAPFGRCSDEDAETLVAVYADLDDEGAFEAAAHWSYETGNFPTFSVYTGRSPHTRVQLYWRLFEPLRDRKAWKSILKAAARKTNGDPSVVNYGRVLRLGGSIAWPVKPGRVLEMTKFGRPQGGKTWNLSSLADALGHDASIDGADDPADEHTFQEQTTRKSGLFDEEVIEDGREAYMARMVNASFIRYCGEHGAWPTPKDIVDDVWPVYSRKVDLTRPGRGLPELWAKARAICERAERGEHTKFKTIDEAIEAFQRNEHREQLADEAAAPGPSGFVFDGTDAPPPRWLIKGLLHDDGVCFIGGQSGAGKTFVHVDIAVALASQQQFFGRKVKERVGVAILAAEGSGTLPTRIKVARLHRGIEKPLPIATLRNVPDLARPESIPPLLESLRSVDALFRAANGVRLGCVIIDTVAAAFGLEDEDDNSEAAKAIRTMAGIGLALGVVVVPIHHYGKSASTGLRGASAWRAGADTVLSVLADRALDTGEVGVRQLALAKSRVTDEGVIGDFELKFHSLGTDEDGDEIGACYVVPGEASDDVRKRAGKLSPAQEALRRAYHEAASRGYTQHLFGEVASPSVLTVRLDDVQREFAKFYVVQGADPKKTADATRQAFNRAVCAASKLKMASGNWNNCSWIWEI